MRANIGTTGPLAKTGLLWSFGFDVRLQLAVGAQANGKSTPRDAILAGVAELVDALDLGSSDESCGGSSPSARTKRRQRLRMTITGGSVFRMGWFP